MKRIAVEVVYPRPDATTPVRVELADGATVEQAIHASGLMPNLPEPVRVGVFGRLRARGDALADGDRVEIYRPLVADPKAARRRRAASKLRGGARPG